MTPQEVIDIMSKPLSTTRVPEYKQIYKMATGKNWNSCMCGTGWNNFTRVCINYANQLKINLNKNN